MVRKSEDGPRTGWVYLGKVDCMLINLLHILLLHLWFHSTEAQVPPVSTVKALMMFTVIDNLRACIPLLDLSVLNELKVSPKGLRFNLCRLARSSVIVCHVWWTQTLVVKLLITIKCWYFFICIMVKSGWCMLIILKWWCFFKKHLALDIIYTFFILTQGILLHI